MFVGDIAGDSEEIVLAQPLEHFERFILAESLAAGTLSEPGENCSNRLGAIEFAEKAVFIETKSIEF